MRACYYLIMLGLLGACASAGTNTDQTLTTASVDTAAEVARIDDTYALWRTAVETADIPSYVSVLHPDVRMFPPGAPVVAGSGSYASFLGPVFATATYRIEVTKMPAIEVFGDLAMVEYEYIIHLTLKDAETGVSEPGALTANRTRSQYFDVLRKNDAGKWGVWRHTWRVMPD
ncbi:MAG: nuclear transport factor 2 family protein [Pseudomonadales bacterium]